MEQTQLDTFRRALISLREEIKQLAMANREAAGTVALDQSKVGRLSRMDALKPSRWHKRQRAGGSYNYRKSTVRCVVWMPGSTVTVKSATRKSP